MKRCAVLVLTVALFLPAAAIDQQLQPYEDEVCVSLPEIDGEPTRLVGLSLHVTGKDVALPADADRIVSVQCPPTATEELEALRVEIAELEAGRVGHEAEINFLEEARDALEHEIVELEAHRQEYIQACLTAEAA